MLTTHHLETLRALVNRIIPPDGDPGGWDGGVGDYVVLQFERDLKPLLQTYRLGLEALDSEARAAYALDFAQLSATQQDALLTRVEAKVVSTPWPFDPASFFRMACEHCAEGYYGDPANGGNPNGASWGMIGFEVRE